MEEDEENDFISQLRFSTNSNMVPHSVTVEVPSAYGASSLPRRNIIEMSMFAASQDHIEESKMH